LGGKRREILKKGGKNEFGGSWPFSSKDSKYKFHREEAEIRGRGREKGANREKERGVPKKSDQKVFTKPNACEEKGPRTTKNNSKRILAKKEGKRKKIRGRQS